jgi:hypothetical protein
MGMAGENIWKALEYFGAIPALKNRRRDTSQNLISAYTNALV